MGSLPAANWSLHLSPPQKGGACREPQNARAPVHDLHGAAPQHKGGADHDGVAQLLGSCHSLSLAGHHVAGRLVNLELCQQIKPLVAVLRTVDGLWLRAPDADAAIPCATSACR